MGALAFVASVALVLLTTLLRRQADQIGRTANTIQTSELLRRQLLSHEAAKVPSVRRDLEGAFQSTLRDAKRQVQSTDEQAAAAGLSQAVDSYFDGNARIEVPLQKTDELI